MLHGGSAWLAAWTLAVGAPEGLSPVRPDSAPHTEVAVVPVAVTGELPARWIGEASARLVEGLSRGALHVQALPVPADCRTAACWSQLPELAGTDFVVRATLEVGDARDYTLSVDVVSAKTGKVVASTAGVCELCGFEEAVSMIEARAAVLAPELVRLGAVFPVLLFRSEPPGVDVRLDGVAYGTTPVRVLAPAGPHTVKATKDGYLPQSFAIEAVDGVSKEVELRLLPRPAPPPDPAPAGRAWIVVGAVMAGAGTAGLAAGVSMLILDGRPYRRRCAGDADGTCQFDYETTIGGAVATAVGGAALVAGAALLVRGLSRRARARSSRVGRGRIVTGPRPGLALRIWF